MKKTLLRILIILPAILLFSLISLGLLILILLPFLNTSILWVLIPLQQFMLALIYPAALILIINLAKQGQKGLALGSYNSVKSLAYAFSPFSGVLMGITFKMPVIIAGVFILFSALFLWMTFRKKILGQGT